MKERKNGKKTDRSAEYCRLLELVGLDETFLDRFPHEAGGQLQRVCIARAVACEPEFILFDEAISFLDAHTQVQVMDLLKELKEKLGLTYVFITHDLTSVTYLMTKSCSYIKDGSRNISQIPDRADHGCVCAKAAGFHY